jgi:predicted nucleic acid-binding protein
VIVVSDAGPLIYLGGVGRLPLLRDLFGRVIVPRQVWEEVAGGAVDRPGSAEVAAAAAWLDVRTPSAFPAIEHFADVLGAGEAAAIALCLELDAELLLCDDREARHIAAGQGIRVVGTLGLLVRGKRVGLLDAVRPIVDAMVAMGLRVSTDLVAEILILAGEK